MSSTHLNGVAFSLPPQAVLYESDVEDELEVDQLDSDTDPDEQLDTAKPNKTKNGAGKQGERIPGHTLLPAVRLQNMIQADGVTGNLALSREGLFVLSIATEEFIKRLIQAGHREASAHRRNQINYIDMAATTQQYQEFMCLAETIPAPISLSEALLMRRDKERELLEDNPAMGVNFISSSSFPSPDPEPNISVPNRSTNGKDQPNGSSNNTKRATKKSKKVEHGTDWVVDPKPISEPPHSHYRSALNSEATSSTSSTLMPLPLNGHSSALAPQNSPPYSREHSLDSGSHQSQSRPPEPDSHTPSYDAAWPGQFTGPASGFLVVPFGRVSQNPGRTIYSHSNRPG